MEVSLITPFYIILSSVLLGAILGLIYDMLVGLYTFVGLNFRVKPHNKKLYSLFNRNYHFIKNKLIIGLCDFLYFVLILPLIVIFFFGVNNGIIRWYIVLGILVGFLIYRLTMGRLIFYVIQTAFTFLRLCILNIIGKALKPVKRLLKLVIIKAKKRKVKQKSKVKKIILLTTGRVEKQG